MTIKTEIILSPVQQVAFDGLMEGIGVGGVLVLKGRPGCEHERRRGVTGHPSPASRDEHALASDERRAGETGSDDLDGD